MPKDLLKEFENGKTLKEAQDEALEKVQKAYDHFKRTENAPLELRKIYKEFEEWCRTYLEDGNSNILPILDYLKDADIYEMIKSADKPSKPFSFKFRF